MASHGEHRTLMRYPLLALLHPREQTRLVMLLLPVGLLLWGLAALVVGMPIWGATTVTLSLLLVPGVLKWRMDLRRHGRTVMLLSVLLALQGFHSIEHVVQWLQYHWLGWLPQMSSGLISAANAEWVHFIWNWSVVTAVALLLAGGMHNRWAWALLVFAIAHASEHSYMMVRYLQLKAELGALGVPRVSAQGLPGILGRDGWLARSPTTQNTFLCRIPGVTTINRIDVHFWWNSIETPLLFLAGHTFLRSRIGAGMRG